MSGNQPQKGRSIQRKNWVVTWHVMCDSIVFPHEELAKKGIKYSIAGLETAPETGQLHYQAYIQLDRKKRFNAVLKILETVLDSADGKHPYLAMQRGSNEEARDYCKKDKNFTEHGEFTQSFALGGRGLDAEQGPRNHAKKQCYELLRKGEPFMKVLDEYPHMISDMEKWRTYVGRERATQAFVLYLWGDTGRGKTMNTMKACDRKALSFYKKAPGHKWFSGYVDQDVVIFEEFASCFTLSTFLALCDPIPPAVEVKGGHVTISAPFYVILSNVAMEDQYPTVIHPHRRAAFYRRLTKVQNVDKMDYGEIEACVYEFFEAHMDALVDYVRDSAAHPTDDISPLASATKVVQARGKVKQLFCDAADHVISSHISSVHPDSEAEEDTQILSETEGGSDNPIELSSETDSDELSEHEWIKRKQPYLLTQTRVKKERSRSPVRRGRDYSTKGGFCSLPHLTNTDYLQCPNCGPANQQASTKMPKRSDTKRCYKNFLDSDSD